MTADTVSIASYTKADREDLLSLLIELQYIYFHQNASAQLQELQQEVDFKQSYSQYVDFLQQNASAAWQVFIAKTNQGKAVGFIIGSIEIDEHLVLNNIGKFEDWFVEQSFRGQGIGLKLYNELEKWFKQKGCQQVQSDTWEGNDLSIKAHKQAGFFISGIQFRKKL